MEKKSSSPSSSSSSSSSSSETDSSSESDNKEKKEKEKRKKRKKNKCSGNKSGVCKEYKSKNMLYEELSSSHTDREKALEKLRLLKQESSGENSTWVHSDSDRKSRSHQHSPEDKGSERNGGIRSRSRAESSRRSRSRSPCSQKQGEREARSRPHQSPSEVQKGRKGTQAMVTATIEESVRAEHPRDTESGRFNRAQEEPPGHQEHL